MIFMFDRNGHQWQRYEWHAHQNDRSSGLSVKCILTKSPINYVSALRAFPCQLLGRLRATFLLTECAKPYAFACRLRAELNNTQSRSQVSPSNTKDLIHLLRRGLVGFALRVSVQRCGDLLHQVGILQNVQAFAFALPVLFTHKPSRRVTRSGSWLLTTSSTKALRLSRNRLTLTVSIFPSSCTAIA